MIAVNYAITTISEPAALLSFDAFYNSFSAKLLSHLTLVNASSSSSNRSINSVQHGGRGRGGSDRGRGRGCSRHNPYHRCGRGCSRGRGRGGRYGQNDFNSTSTPWYPEACDYLDNEWYSLSFNQQQRVRDLRCAVGHRNPNGQENANQGERNINATETEHTSVPGEVSVGGSSIPSQAGQAGDAFASRQGSGGSRSSRNDGGSASS